MREAFIMRHVNERDIYCETCVMIRDIFKCKICHNERDNRHFDISI